MLVVLLVDHISNYKIGLLTTLSKNSKRYKKIRSDLKQLYYYMVQIRSRFKKRLENEQMLYASVVAKLYYQMRK